MPSEVSLRFSLRVLVATMVKMGHSLSPAGIRCQGRFLWVGAPVSTPHARPNPLGEQVVFEFLYLPPRQNCIGSFRDASQKRLPFDASAKRRETGRIALSPCES